MSSRVFEVDPYAVDVEQLAVPCGAGSDVSAEQGGHGDQVGFSPNEGRSPGMDPRHPPVVPFAAQGFPVGVAVEFLRYGRPVDAGGVQGGEFIGGVHPVRSCRSAPAREPHQQCCRAESDSEIAERV